MMNVLYLSVLLSNAPVDYVWLLRVDFNLAKMSVVCVLDLNCKFSKENLFSTNTNGSSNICTMYYSVELGIFKQHYLLIT